MSRRKPADPRFEAIIKRFMDVIRGVLGDKAVAVVAFGSRAWGGYRDGSDYDILLLHRCSEDEAVEAAAEAAFTVSTELSIPIEPVTMSIYRFLGLDSELARTCMDKGIIYFFDGGRPYRGVALDLLSLAEEYLDMARALYERGMVRGVIDMAYNAIELAIKSLMLWDNHEPPRSHGGIISEFGRLYVLKGVFSRGIGRDVNKALVLRNRARYDPKAELGVEDAKAVMETAEAILKAVKSRLSR